MADHLGSAIIGDGAICYASLNDPRYPELVGGGAVYWPNYTAHRSGPSLPYHDTKLMFSENNTATTPYPHFDFGIANQKSTAGTLTFECVFMTDYTNFNFSGSLWTHPIFNFYTDWASFTVNINDSGGVNTGVNGVISVNAFFFSTIYYEGRDDKYINDGNIHHLIVELNNPASAGGSIKIYLDGVLANTVTPTNTGAFNNIRGFGVGRPPADGLGTHFGYIGHIAMYNKALTAAQRTNHYELTRLYKPPSIMYFDQYVYKWLPASGRTKFNIDGTWSDKDTTRLL